MELGDDGGQAERSEAVSLERELQIRDGERAPQLAAQPVGYHFFPKFVLRVPVLAVYRAVSKLREESVHPLVSGPALRHRAGRQRKAVVQIVLRRHVADFVRLSKILAIKVSLWSSKIWALVGNCAQCSYSSWRDSTLHDSGRKYTNDQLPRFSPDRKMLGTFPVVN